MKTSEMLKQQSEKVAADYKAILEGFMARKLLTKKQVGDMTAAFQDGWYNAIKFSMVAEDNDPLDLVQTKGPSL